jgi:phenylacetate-coenzyme A ligase PaaK-like adenylate-forming protein
MRREFKRLVRDRNVTRLVLNVSTHADIAKIFELSAARLWRDQGKRREARDLLVPIYGWFTEGFDASVLKSLQIYELPGTNKETEGLVRVGRGFGNSGVGCLAHRPWR